MAQAYAQPGTGLTGDAGLATAVLTGLDHLHDRVYHPGTVRYGNWWEWQIGSPRLLLDTLALLHDEAGEARRSGYLAAVDHFVPDSMLGSYTGTSTGANRVDLCRVVALRGILGAAPPPRSPWPVTPSHPSSPTSPQATASTPTAPSSSTAGWLTPAPTAVCCSTGSAASSPCSTARPGT
ncbi:hypothetical protein GCM10020000_23470 [Streptomyces olivoverticillatus]